MTSGPASDAPTEFLPATQAEVARFLTANFQQERRAIHPTGGRTALHLGLIASERSPGEPAAVNLVTTRLNQKIDYPARDMTVTVEAGMRVDELNSLLRVERQQLPIDVPQPHRASVGGAVAVNASGPRRYGYGTFRDYVIGLTAISATGQIFHSGGRVVKNVAGYDLCKLLIGSFGTLAVITQLTFKLKPIPEQQRLLWIPLRDWSEADQAVAAVMSSEARPVVIELLDSQAARQVMTELRQALPADRPVLIVGVEGTDREVNWQLEVLRRDLSGCNSADWEEISSLMSGNLLRILTEFPLSADDPLTFQANLLPSRVAEFAELCTHQGISLLAHAGNGIVIGHFPDAAATLENSVAILNPLREFARRVRGNLIVLNCPETWKKSLPMFGVPEPGWPLMEKLKSTLDPARLLNPGRMFSL